MIEKPPTVEYIGTTDSMYIKRLFIVTMLSLIICTLGIIHTSSPKYQETVKQNRIEECKAYLEKEDKDA